MMGFGFMFKLDDTCIENHLNERRVRTVEDAESVGVGSLYLSSVSSFTVIRLPKRGQTNKWPSVLDFFVAII